MGEAATPFRTPRRPRIFWGLSRASWRAFECIATGQEPGPFPRVEAAITPLIDRGLVYQVGTRVLVKDRFGEVRIPVYDTALDVHRAYCDWCSRIIDAAERRSA